MVTKRLRPDEDRRQGRSGRSASRSTGASRAIPNHTGPLANMLTPSAMDPNTWTPEYKAFLVKLEKA